MWQRSSSAEIGADRTRNDARRRFKSHSPKDSAAGPPPAVDRSFNQFKRGRVFHDARQVGKIPGVEEEIVLAKPLQERHLMVVCTDRIGDGLGWFT